jgi:hypothetical protein
MVFLLGVGWLFARLATASKEEVFVVVSATHASPMMMMISMGLVMQA